VIIVGQQQNTTLAAAQAETPVNIAGFTNFTDEGVVFAKVINKRSGSGTWVIIADPTYYRGNTINLATGAFVPTDHQTLSNRSATNAHPATAIEPDTTNFGGRLALTDDTVQKALDALDDSVTSISLGGTGQTTQTAAFDALAPSTTKGDLIVHNGTDNIRVAVGATDGHSLVVDAASAAGVKWAAAAAGIFAGTFTGTAITPNAVGSGEEMWTYTSASDQTFTGVGTLASLTNGKKFTIVGGAAANMLSFADNDAANGWLLNGPYDLTYGKVLTVIYNSTLARLVEVSRS
jgi:hypothetical protein